MAAGFVLGAQAAFGQGAPAFPEDTLTLVTREGERHTLTVELARTREQRRWGLMFRRELARDRGMLFVYPRVRRVSLWMKNTFIPLDMLFIAADGEIVKIHRDAEPKSTHSIRSGEPVKAVLEVRAGTAERLNLAPGARVQYSVFQDS